MDVPNGRTMDNVIGGGKGEYVRSLWRLVPNHQGQVRLEPSITRSTTWGIWRRACQIEHRTVVLVFNPLNLYISANACTIHLGDHQHKPLSLPCQPGHLEHNAIIFSEQCIHSNHTGSFPFPFPFPFLVPSHTTPTSSHPHPIITPR
jgi:hypothetical protein